MQIINFFKRYISIIIFSFLALITCYHHDFGLKKKVTQGRYQAYALKIKYYNWSPIDTFLVQKPIRFMKEEARTDLFQINREYPYPRYRTLEAGIIDQDED